MTRFRSYSRTTTSATTCCVRIDADVTSIPDEAFFGHHDIVEVLLPDGLREIGEKSFCCCASLSKVSLPEGLLTIGPGAFSNCHKLTTIHIPGSVTSVGIAAFIECSMLKEVVFCKGSDPLLIIDCQAFYDCPSLTTISIPSTVKVINVGTFRGCKSLTNVHLSDGLQWIGRDAFRECLSLLSINIPASVVGIHVDAFGNCHHLHGVAIARQSKMEYNDHYPGIFEELSSVEFWNIYGRWEKYPLHAMCFYHSRQEAESRQYNNDPVKWLDEHADELSLGDYAEVDCLGMTALHVLACSGTHNLHLYRRLIDNCPEAMIVTDYWGKTPLDYVLLSTAPEDVLHFFFNMHKQKWGALPFDFGTIINRLKFYKSAECIRQYIHAQRTYFPELEVNWQEIVDNSMIFNKNEAAFQKTPITVFRVLAEASASSRDVCMSLEHQRAIDDWISKLMLIHDDPHKYLSGKQLNQFVRRIHGFRDREIPLDFDRLIGYSEKSRVALLKKCQGFIIKSVQQREELLACTSNTIELALWKSVLIQSSEQTLRPKEDNLIRGQSRQIGGRMCQVIIPNVLSFL